MGEDINFDESSVHDDGTWDNNPPLCKANKYFDNSVVTTSLLATGVVVVVGGIILHIAQAASTCMQKASTILCWDIKYGLENVTPKSSYAYALIPDTGLKHQREGFLDTATCPLVISSTCISTHWHSP